MERRAKGSLTAKGSLDGAISFFVFFWRFVCGRGVVLLGNSFFLSRLEEGGEEGG